MDADSGWTSRVPGDFEFQVYQRANLNRKEALRWWRSGIAPYQAVGYRSAGLSLKDAIACSEAGITGAEAAAMETAQLRSRIDEATSLLAPLKRRCPERLETLEPKEIGEALQALREGVDADIVGSWLESGGPAFNIAAWLVSGVPAPGASRLSGEGYGPPSPRQVHRYGDAGFSEEASVPWIAKGIAPRRAWSYARRGIDAETASGLISSGISAAKAAVIRNEAVESVPEPPPGVSTTAPWTAEELAELGRGYLEVIIERDLKAEPGSTNSRALRKQIVSEQSTRKHRGMVRWIDHGPDEILLYEPAHARFGRSVVGALASVDSWGDLQKLARRRNPVSRFILQVVWDRWDPQCPEECGIWDESALEEYYETEPDVAGVGELLEAFSSDMPFELLNENGDGENVFIDPFDWQQMGVPLLLHERYYVEHSTMVSTWESAPSEYLSSIQQSAKAIGWSLARGTRGDLLLD